MFMQVQEMEEKLNKLQSGVILVKPEDKKIIEESFSERVTQWRKRKRMFKELWDNITENSPKDQKEFKVLGAPFCFTLSQLIYAYKLLLI
jgi:26S proteasome regulatory subunit (ATPase 3-interacting protein)